jgi:hypothetical protein
LEGDIPEPVRQSGLMRHLGLWEQRPGDAVEDVVLAH